MRTIRLNDTRTGELCALEPRDPGHVGIYACGPTVYSRIHIGNARPFVIFSLLKRYLEHEGYRSTLVINVTDINDKIYAAANAAGLGSVELAGEMTALYRTDTDRLALGRPDFEPLASETIDGIVELIATLISRDHAYAVGGDVYFRVRSVEGYGTLSHRDVEQMDQGEGVEGADLKEDPLDFALWKAAKEGEDTAWPSPWGDGRPGWHIECSAMAERLLGLELDIHGGGIDLAFPHHENEAAQTFAAHGRHLARIWMHNGMVQVGGDEKMSKSLGNISALGDVLDEYGRDPVVLWLVSGHYRQPLSFAPEALEQAASSVQRIREAGRRLTDEDPPPAAIELAGDFFDALAEDFNTPRALAVLYDWIRDANRSEQRGGRGILGEMLGVLGLENLLEGDSGPPAPLLELARRREAARAARDWAQADALRDELRRSGWEVRDGANGPELFRAP